MEQDQRETSGVARSQNAMYVLPHDTTSGTQLLVRALERVEKAGGSPQLLVVTPDAETALELARLVHATTGAAELVVVPVTGAARAGRLLRARPAQVVLGAPDALLSLIQGSVLKLEAVRTVLMAWADELLAAGGGEALGTIMGEVPREAARLIVAGSVTPQVEELAERYARRAARTGETALPAAPLALEFVSVSADVRPAALRRVLDELDPERAAVFVRSPSSEEEAQEILRHLGYPSDGASIRVTRDEPVEAASVVVLYDLPASRDELRRVLGATNPRLIALAQPRQLTALRTLAGGGRVTPLRLAGAAERARGREAAVRDELRAVLADGAPSRELLALEPLLETHDGIEIAAAALRLLERERERPSPAPAAAAAAGAPPADTWVRLFVSVGSRDGARPGDLVGAITGEAGISRDQIGRVDVRESHSVVEVAPAVAPTVIDKMTGATIRGRRVIARPDQDRRPAGRGAERPPRGDRAPRGGRGRGDRGESGGRFDRGNRDDRPPRGRAARAPRDREE